MTERESGSTRIVAVHQQADAPVGASTVAWALRKPWMVPSAMARFEIDRGLAQVARRDTLVDRLRRLAVQAHDLEHAVAVLAVARERPR